MKNRKIRILVLGDDQVGKTSWVTSLVSESQPENIPHVIDPVVFTEMFVHTFQISTVLIDTDRDILNQPERFADEVKSAQVILLLYDLANAASIQSLNDTWLPRIEIENPSVPVLIIGNKRDLLDEIQISDKISEEHRIEKVMVPLIKGFRQVQMGFECSGLLSQYISNVIYAAHVAVLFPLSPLYDNNTKTLTTAFERALSRIFRICDKDNDLCWTDDELRDFQQEVFQAELTNNDIAGIKLLIREEQVALASAAAASSRNLIPNSTDPYDRNALITFDGFKILQKKCVELIKMQICWAVLRHFNYDDKLDIDRKLFKDQLMILKDSGQTVELSGKANQFLLQRCFKRFGNYKSISQNNDQQKSEFVLPKANLESLFFPYSKKGESNSDPVLQHPFADTLSIVTPPERDYILQEEWLCLWAHKTRADYQEVYRMMVHMGYSAQLEETFLITNPTNCLSAIKRMSSRYVYNICIIGIQDSQTDLHTIMELYENKQPNNNQIESSKKSITQPVDYATQIRFQNDRKKIIIFTFVHQYNVDELFSDDSENKKRFDQIGIIYRESNELSKFIEQKDTLPKFMECPKFFVQLSPNQDDKLNEVLRAHSREHIRFNSIADLTLPTLNSSIFNIIQNPTKGLHPKYVRLIRDKDPFLRKNLKTILIAGGITTFIGLLAWAHKSTFKSVLSSIKNALHI